MLGRFYGFHSPNARPMHLYLLEDGFKFLLNIKLYVDDVLLLGRGIIMVD